MSSALSPPPTFPEGNCNLFVAGEYGLPVVIIILLCALYATKKISTATFGIYWVGVALGCVWEYAHAFLKDFIVVNPCISVYMPEKTVYPMVHALHDGMLFLLAYLLCLAVFGRDKFKEYGFAITCFLVAILVGQEILVEMAFNGRYWRYVTSRANPVLFTWGADKKVVNLVPVLEWCLASMIFAAIMLALHQKYGTR